jgi:protein-tyrosine phosphatase
MTTNLPEAALEGVWNLRDIGGRPTGSGGFVRPRRVFRSGTLWFATMADCLVLDRFGFDTVIDLRLSKEEIKEEAWLCELLDTRYHHLPIEVAGDRSNIALAHPGGADHYARLLEHNADHYVRALEVVCEPDNHPALFHCAAGLDRTGILAALVLAALGVDESAIVSDYAASAAGFGQIRESYRGHAFYGEAARAAERHRVDAAVMVQFLDQHGGADGLCKWAIANGLAESSIDTLRTALVVAD